MILETLKKRWKLILPLLVLAIAVPITVLLSQKQQETRSHASTGNSVSFSLTPSTGTESVDQEFSVDVYLNNPGGNSISGVDARIPIPQGLDYVQFLPSDSFDNIAINTHSDSTGEFRFSAVNADNIGKIDNQQSILLGTLTLAGSSAGNANITASTNSQVVSLGQSAALPVSGGTVGTYIVQPAANVSGTPQTTCKPRLTLPNGYPSTSSSRTLVYSLRLKNTCSSVQTFNLSVTNPQAGWSYTFENLNNQPITSLSVNAKSKLNLKLKVTFAQGAAAKRYTVKAHAVAGNNQDNLNLLFKVLH